jgi:hypothetical protein
LQAALGRKNEFFILENAELLLNNTERIFDPNFTPTNDDIALSRYKTTGVSETQLKVKSFIVKIFDVGGHRSERKYWVPYFVSSITGAAGDVLATHFL